MIRRSMTTEILASMAIFTLLLVSCATTPLDISVTEADPSPEEDRTVVPAAVVRETLFDNRDMLLSVMKEIRNLKNPAEWRERLVLPRYTADAVAAELRYFQGPGRRSFSRYLARSTYYLPIMQDIFRENSVPRELTYLAFVESGFNPLAYSRAGACGPWQFMKRTGRRYGLEVSWWVDERRDPIKSTHAAARYLKDLHAMFNSWGLAFIAYNAGEGKIERVLRTRDRDNLWDVIVANRLKRETRSYVPKFLASYLIALHPEHFGFMDVAYLPPMRYDEIEIPSTTDLSLIARTVGIDTQVIRHLNPQLRRWSSAPGKSAMRIPFGLKAAFEQKFAELKPKQVASLNYRHYQVRKGDTLSHIARRFGTAVEPIVSLNRLSSEHFVRAGRTLLIPVPMASN
ncbi:MAG: transglycosylase SLT domain-containing protein [Deltaproteobacteria bacterium]|nr:transglycosylase SLT domain-containing protein [Deltaproteobacteria bacterium]